MTFFAVDRRQRWLALAGAGLLALLAAILLLLAFGWPLLRGLVAHRAAVALDRPVRLGTLDRDGGTLLAPILALTDVQVGQPDWAGPGDMLTIRRARIRLPLSPLLLGRVRPEAIAIEGLRAWLVRDAAGRANWRRHGVSETPSGAAPIRLGQMTLRDAVVRIDDARRDRHATATIAIEPTGFRLTGSGTIAGTPARIAMTGAGVAGQVEWPFTLDLRSAAVTLRVTGRAATPLDTGHFRARIETQGRDLTDLDRLIEAGLPATQPFHLTGDLVHDRPTWRIDRLTGRVGRSDVTGRVVVTKPDGRTFLDASLVSNGFDFADLASSEGRAKAAAKARALGPRFFPDTRIDLSRLRRTDGVLHFDLRRLLFDHPSAFRSVSGVLTLDHGVLTAAPLRAMLAHGRVDGTAIVRHQSGAPLLSLDLTLADARLEGIFTLPETATGPLAGRARVSGAGETVREAMAHAGGAIGIASRDGSINRRAALAAGSDFGRALMSGGEDRTDLRCLIGRFTLRDGMSRPNLLVLDTGVSRADGQGQVDLSTERVDLAFTGRSKQQGGLRFDQPVRIAGTILRPEVVPPPQAKSAGGILKMVGKALSGGPPPTATDADCGKLAALALR